MGGWWGTRAAAAVPADTSRTDLLLFLDAPSAAATSPTPSSSRPAPAPRTRHTKQR